MYYGYGFGYGRGRGFGFRGASSLWPYVGWGRRGLGRRRYPGGFVSPAYAPYATHPAYNKEELDYLKEDAKALKEELSQVEARMRDLEGKNED